MPEKAKAKGVAIATIVVLLCATAWIAIRNSNTTASGQVFYYDLATGELFGGDPTANPPIDAPSGPGSGVRAMVYGCGGCSAAKRQTVYLMTYSQEARDAMASAEDQLKEGIAVSPELASAIARGQQVASVPETGEVQWVSSTSPEGMALMNTSKDLCQDQTPIACFP